MGGDKLPITRARKNPYWKTPEQIQREMADVANPVWEKVAETAGDSQKQIIKTSGGKNIKVHTALSQFLVDQAKANGPHVFKFQAKEAVAKARKAQEEADKNKGMGKENEKIRKTTQPEATVPRLQRRQIIKPIWDSNRKDLKKNSATRGTFRTPSEQAAYEPNFIGKQEDVFYFILDEHSYYTDLIPGEYAIIYTRPVGEKFGSTSKSALIDPNLTGGNTIEVVQDIDDARVHGNEPLVAFMRQLMRDSQNEKDPYICTGQIKSGGRVTHFAFRAPTEVQARPYKAAVDLYTYPMSSDENHIASPLDANFHESMRPNGTTVSFGYKEMCNDCDPHRDCWTSYGFQFIELEIATFCDGKNERQLIVGVKLPRYGDISSEFILKQLVPYDTHLHNIAMMKQEEMDCVWQGDIVHDFHENSGDDEVEEGRKIQQRQPGIWRLPPFSALGLSDLDLNTFQASTFEMYILHRDDTVYALETVLAFMNKWLKDALDSRGRNGLREARDYVKHRLVVAKRERALIHRLPFPKDDNAAEIDIENVPGVDSRGPQQ